MENKNRKGIIAAAVVALALAGIVAAKTLRSKPEQSASSSPQTQSAASTVYLFMNSNDQDGGCSRIYSMFDELSSQLPTQIQKVKLDVNSTDQSVFKKFNVLVLPTILFVNGKGEVENRIEGEGEEIEAKIKSAFQLASQGSGAK